MSSEESADCEFFSACNADTDKDIALGVTDAESREAPFDSMHSDRNPLHIVEHSITYRVNMIRIGGVTLLGIQSKPTQEAKVFRVCGIFFSLSSLSLCLRARVL